ncbi:MAG TPA: purine-nucleoside phosphorylase [Bryobacteraceae bacterium]|nr:purine-nucleoside phosphorylase [Bryobacteraceae bacterium]
MVEAGRFIRSQWKATPRIGVVLGSGLAAFADTLTGAVKIPYKGIPGLPESTATGHRSELVLGYLNNLPVAVLSGRFHLYEGYSAQQVAAGIYLLHEMGVEQVVLTNAAGGIKQSFTPGSLVLISDHINLQGANPLVGRNGPNGNSRFADMTEAYSRRLRGLTKHIAGELGIPIFEGVYAALLGPSYETPAEIRFLRAIGADLVGMSTACETIAANQLGMEVLGISCVTNLAAGLSGKKLEHEEVLAIGRQISGTFSQLLQSALPKFRS